MDSPFSPKFVASPPCRFLNRSKNNSLFQRSKKASTRSASHIDQIYRSANHVVEQFTAHIPVLILEALIGSERSALPSVNISSNDGWAWFVVGRRLFVWQTVGSFAKSLQCWELTLPPSDLAHGAALVSVFMKKGNSMPSCLAVSPEGTIRFWPSIVNDSLSIEANADLQSSVSPIEDDEGGVDQPSSTNSSSGIEASLTRPQKVSSGTSSASGIDQLKGSPTKEASSNQPENVSLILSNSSENEQPKNSPKKAAKQLKTSEPLALLTAHKMEREPGKRRIKPSQNFLDFEDLGESSDDSDFRIEDHDGGSDDDSNFDSDGKSSESGSESASGSEDEDEDKDVTQADVTNLSVSDVLSKAEKTKTDKDFTKILICCVCLGDFSNDQNEIIECDCCGVTVHEGCYGVPDSASVSSNESACSTEPWFCEACRAGVEDPVCELCPNKGGIFKETDVGKWVHLVCALYIPGVAFGEVDKLSNITLFELPFSRWGTKVCQHCQDSRLMRTGIVLQCDAGMCRTYFHVTCGQREGLLTEATAEEADQADPFYAHCKLHCDKTQARIRKRNWLALQFRASEMRKQKRENVVQNWERIQRKLLKYRSAYSTTKSIQPQPWVPTQKRPRLLTSSASACRLLWKKAECMGIDTASLEAMDIHIAALMDVPKKWHVQPAFSIEFVGYFLDRNSRIDSFKKQLAATMESNSKLIKEQESLQKQYDQAVKANADIVSKNTSFKNILQSYHDVILAVCPNKKLPNLDVLSRPAVEIDSNLFAPSSPAAAKANIGYPVGFVKQAVMSKKLVPAPISDSPVLPNSKCGICKRSNDQHLLASCDTCHLFYHLGCLNPPLTRMPTKTKLMGWQCSECDKESSDSEVENVDTSAPRKLRHPIKDNNDKNGQMDDSSDLSRLFSDSNVSSNSLPVSPGNRVKKPSNGILGATSFTVRKKSLDSEEIGQGTKPNKKRKLSVTDSEEPRQHIKIFIKSIPNKGGSATTPQLFVASANPVSPAETSAKSSPVPVISPSSRPVRQPKQPKVKEVEKMNDCDTCSGAGDFSNMVSCDECKRCFHFGCLDPPVKKSPKVRGYSWHCANCDPTESDDSE